MMARGAVGGREGAVLSGGRRWREVSLTMIPRTWASLNRTFYTMPGHSLCSNAEVLTPSSNTPRVKEDCEPVPHAAARTPRSAADTARTRCPERRATSMHCLAVAWHEGRGGLTTGHRVRPRQIAQSRAEAQCGAGAGSAAECRMHRVVHPRPCAPRCATVHGAPTAVSSASPAPAIALVCALRPLLLTAAPHTCRHAVMHGL